MKKESGSSSAEKLATAFNEQALRKDLPPLPWTYETNTRGDASLGNGFVYLLDANGRKIASLWAKPHEKLAMAELICDASERARQAPGDAK